MLLNAKYPLFNSNQKYNNSNSSIYNLDDLENNFTTEDRIESILIVTRHFVDVEEDGIGV